MFRRSRPRGDAVGPHDFAQLLLPRVSPSGLGPLLLSMSVVGEVVPRRTVAIPVELSEPEECGS